MSQMAAHLHVDRMEFGQIAVIDYPVIIEMTTNVRSGQTHWLPPEAWPFRYWREPDRLKNFGFLIRHPIRRAVRDAVTRYPSTFTYWTRGLDDYWIKWLFAHVEWISDGRLLYGMATTVDEADAVAMVIGDQSYPQTLGGWARVKEGPDSSPNTLGESA